jgi:hypothetical protein
MARGICNDLYTIIPMTPDMSFVPWQTKLLYDGDRLSEPLSLSDS